MAGTTTHEATVTAISNVTLAQIKVATTPSNANHATSKSYVDSRVIKVSSDDSSTIEIDLTGNTELVFSGGRSITTDTTADGNAVEIAVDAAMTDINSITSGSGENYSARSTSRIGLLLVLQNTPSDSQVIDVDLPTLDQTIVTVEGCVDQCLLEHWSMNARPISTWTMSH